MIRVAVIDDHELIRHGLEYLLRPFDDLDVVFQGSRIADLRSGDLDHDVLILDLYLATDRPCVAEIRELSAITRVLVVSASGRPADVLAAIRSGANGYVTKDAPAELVVDALRTVAVGGFYLSAGLADILQNELGAPPSDAAQPRLSGREEEVLAYIAQGFTHAQIARRMEITKATVDTYVERIRAKLQVGNKAQLTRAALDRLERRPEA
ncbi:LuxR C-terminal-related transcriptional regulator [Nonomuraea sp. SYSU D8015]|uniref:LuxR C-terminal-related transcriptional regulator n=1 Tax=Nonomuraea sp. SYSU D8015 TaxID=2593644 RepID=UPI0016617B78|nr:response regulator transcription factor [Nonomuraea sp. SYSU D8015]